MAESARLEIVCASCVPWVRIPPSPQSQAMPDFSFLRRDAGVVERGGLENRCGCKPTQGSNPCLSAKVRRCLAFFLWGKSRGWLNGVSRNREKNRCGSNEYKIKNTKYKISFFGRAG